MNAPNFPRYLMSNDGVRITSHRNQNDPKRIVYQPVYLEPKHSNWGRRTGLLMLSVAITLVVGLVMAGVGVMNHG